MSEKYELRPETKRFWDWMKAQAKMFQMILQRHAEGRETTPEEDEQIKKLWLQFQLKETAKIE
jgi:hypothetical protein